ncbi:MAG: bifunctional hydroxymethylpyrimidine kinase/phosphomethylpyrimidine kinase [Oscillospiraceae bacterium]|nr:bifunctional hydroxymethylpyrimidine kinase/phosphomethylpyrimidine kinase [Oscillospiraceae bacterium]
MKTALTIAGSDSSGGAGIAADIKTMTANGVYAMCAITALTAQNTMGVSAIWEVTPDFLGDQLDAVFSDIVPDAVKIGMVSSGKLVCVMAERLRFYKARNVVVDPVMVATSGSSLIKTDAISALEKELFPLATLITPNIPEAEVLCGSKISNREDMKRVCKEIYDKYKCSVLLKGGHSETSAHDLLYSDGGYEWFCGKRIETENTHGTGCTLSSAVASNLAKGLSLADSVRRSKEYVSGALAAGLSLGRGSGPMNHAFDLHSKFAEDKRASVL